MTQHVVTLRLFLDLLTVPVFVIAVLGGLFYLIDRQQELENQVDHRFRSYDAFFLIEHANIGCMDVSKEDVLSYYSGRETAFSGELINGRWLCNQ